MLTELSIVIPALNEEKYLPKLLTSISRQKFKGKLEVIVVDGQSKDATVKLAEQFQDKITELKVIKVPSGLSYQRNRGADLAKYKYLLFLDSDIVLPDNFLNNLSQKVKTRHKFVDSVLVMSTEPSLGDHLFVFCALLYTIFSTVFLNEPLISGSFILTTKKNHQAVHGFTVGTVIGEDYDYLKRSLAFGAYHTLHYSPFVLTSPRRVRKEGRIHLLIKWLRCIWYMRKEGKPIYNEEKFRYNYGHFQGD